MWAAKAQANLGRPVDSPEPSLRTDTKKDIHGGSAEDLGLLPH